MILTTPVIGRHLYEVFDGGPQPAWDRWLSPLEQRLLHWVGDKGKNSDSAMEYLMPLIISNAFFATAALLVMIYQPAWLNSQGFAGLSWGLALHTTISFVTSCDQQHLIPEASNRPGGRVCLYPWAHRQAYRKLLSRPDSLINASADSGITPTRNYLIALRCTHDSSPAAGNHHPRGR